MLLPKHLALLASVLAPALAFESIDSYSGFNQTDFELMPRDACKAGVHIVALGGEQTTKGDLGYLQSLASSIKGSISHSRIHQIGYPVGADAPTSINFGTVHLHEHLRHYTAHCRHTKIVLLGYSVGAAAVMDVLCGHVDDGSNALSKKYRKQIIGTILYGDLTYLPNLKYDAGTCTSSPGVVPRAKPGKCYPYSKHIQSYCDEGDPQCCGNGSGGDPNIHFVYPSEYDGVATQYIVNRYNKVKG